MDTENSKTVHFKLPGWYTYWTKKTALIVGCNYVVEGAGLSNNAEGICIKLCSPMPSLDSQNGTMAYSQSIAPAVVQDLWCDFWHDRPEFEPTSIYFCVSVGRTLFFLINLNT